MLAQVDHIPDSLIPWVCDGRWWMRSASYQNSAITVCGVPLPEIVEHLRVVYDEPVCVQMISDGLWAPLLGLFSAQPCVEWFGTMLALGLDLRVLGPDRYRRYLQALRTADQWSGARLEISAEANLLRLGIRPSRPELPRNAKQWDHSIEYGRTEYLIECKALSSGNLDGNFDHVLQRFENLGVEHQRDGLVDGLLCFSPWMLRAMEEYRVQLFYESMLPEFTEELTRTLSVSRPDGIARRVGRFGQLSIRQCHRDDGFLGRWETCGYESLPIHRMRRLMTILGDATDNFTHAGAGEPRRIVMVWTGKNYLAPAGVARFIESSVGQVFRLRGTRLKVDPRRLGFDHGVLVGDRNGFDLAGWRTDSAEFRLADVEMPIALLNALSSWRYHAQIDSTSSS